MKNKLPANQPTLAKMLSSVSCSFSGCHVVVDVVVVFHYFFDKAINISHPPSKINGTCFFKTQESSAVLAASCMAT
jgi:hypothetical protein